MDGGHQGSEGLETLRCDARSDQHLFQRRGGNAEIKVEYRELDPPSSLARRQQRARSSTSVFRRIREEMLEHTAQLASMADDPQFAVRWLQTNWPHRPPGSGGDDRLEQVGERKDDERIGRDTRKHVDVRGRLGGTGSRVLRQRGIGRPRPAVEGQILPCRPQELPCKSCEPGRASAASAGRARHVSPGIRSWYGPCSVGAPKGVML